MNQAKLSEIRYAAPRFLPGVKAAEANEAAVETVQETPSKEVQFTVIAMGSDEGTGPNRGSDVWPVQDEAAVVETPAEVVVEEAPAQSDSAPVEE